MSDRFKPGDWAWCIDIDESVEVILGSSWAADLLMVQFQDGTALFISDEELLSLAEYSASLDV